LFRTANQKRKFRTGFGWLKLGLMVLFALVPANSSLALDITLAWDPSSSDVDGYRAFYREAGHSYDYSQPAWEGWESTCTIYGLDDETTYYFVVRAYNELGESGNSNEASSSGDGFGPGTGIGTGVGTGAEAGGCFIASACEG
jgi:hypothetical protein